MKAIEDKPPVNPGWVTTDEAAQATGYKVEYIRILARRGQVVAERFGRDWLINLEAALEYKRRMDALGETKHSPWRDDRPDLAEAGRGRGE